MKRPILFLALAALAAAVAAPAVLGQGALPGRPEDLPKPPAVRFAPPGGGTAQTPSQTFLGFMAYNRLWLSGDRVVRAPTRPGPRCRWHRVCAIDWPCRERARRFRL